MSSSSQVQTTKNKKRQISPTRDENQPYQTSSREDNVQNSSESSPLLYPSDQSLIQRRLRLRKQRKLKFQTKRNNRISIGSSSTTNNEQQTPTRPRKKRKISSTETINLVSPETSNSQKTSTSHRISRNSSSRTPRRTILLNDVPPPPPTPSEISDDDDIVNDVNLSDDDDSIIIGFDDSDDEHYNSTVESDHSDDEFNDIVFVDEISPFQFNQRNSSDNSQRLRNIMLQRNSSPTIQQNTEESDLDLARRLQREETMRFLQNRILMRFGLHDALQNMFIRQQQQLMLEQGIDPALIQLSLTDRDFDDNDYEILLRLDERVKKKTATKKQLKQFEERILKEKENIGRCCICLCDMEGGSKILKLNCDHEFHSECISQWLLNYSIVCPICKKSITEVEKKDKGKQKMKKKKIKN